MFSRRSGFTLAEVLITLTIIGIVAAITIPSLNQNTSGTQYKALAEKVYNVLTSATTRIKTEKGYIDFTSADTVSNDYKNVMSVIKSDQTKNILNYSVKDYSGSPWWDGTIDTRPALVLSDGMFVTFDKDSSTSTTMWVDTNGSKPPNQIGYDVLSFQVKDNSGFLSLQPDGGNCVSNNPSNDCFTDKINGCTCKRLLGQLP